MSMGLYTVKYLRRSRGEYWHGEDNRPTQLIYIVGRILSRTDVIPMNTENSVEPPMNSSLYSLVIFIEN